MKRISNAGKEFLSFENFDKAEKKARKNKLKSKGVKYFDKKYHSRNLINKILEENNNAKKRTDKRG